MDRQQMLQILSVAEDDKLSQALSAIGIDCGECEGYRGAMGSKEPGDENLVSWNATSVRMPASKRPALFDKGAYVEIPKAAPRRMELDPAETGLEDYSPQPQAIGM